MRPGGILVEVGDNGAGFDASTIPTERLGVRVSIVERVTSAGGTVKVDSAPHRGTTITVSWPAPKTEAKPLPGDDADLLATQTGGKS
jgi:signal transduction histidine kinase